MKNLPGRMKNSSAQNRTLLFSFCFSDAAISEIFAKHMDRVWRRQA